MKFTIDKKVLEKFPSLLVALPIITGFDNTKSAKEVLDFLRQTETKLRTEITPETFWKDSCVTAYLDCFKAFGSDPQKFVPAHVALAARVLEGKNLPDINPMVNLYNAMSLKYLTPIGGENLDSLYGNFILKFAQGGEQWIPIGGGKSKSAIAGELVWGDDLDLSTRALNWRQCDRTKMTAETKNGYFIMDGFSEVNKDNIQKAADEFAEIATKLLGGEAKIYWLGKDKPTMEIPFLSQKLKIEITNNKAGLPVRRAKTIPFRKTLNELPQLFRLASWEGENTLGFKLREIILNCVQSVVGARAKIKITDVKIEHPSIENYGDYSTNIALILAGRLGMKPRDLAEKIAEKLNKYIKGYQMRTPITDSLSHQDREKPHDITEEEPKLDGEVLENAKVAGPGFVNLTIRTNCLISLLQGVLTNKNVVISSQISGKKIVVEYTDPNPFKELHLGHFYSNIIGESLALLFEMCGAQVWRADFYGDVGMHVAKSVWGMMKKMKEENVSLENLEKLSVADRQKFLGQGYALGVREYEENEAVAENIRDINYLVYVAAQEILKKKKGWSPIVNYKQYIEGKQSNLDEIFPVYEAGLRWSLAYFETIYKRLGTKFDGYYPESWVGEYGMKLVEEGLKKGVLEKHDGAVIFKGEKYGLHTRVFMNKLGLPTYEAKDFGLAPAKYNDFKYDASLIVTGKEIKEYFHVVLKVMRLIVPDLGNKTLVISHGMVKLPQGKMSSRSGNVITIEGLLDEAKVHAMKIMKNLDVSESEKQDVAQTVAMGAIRYALLKGGPENDVVFDFEKSVSFDGDSGPYLMYTYARCKSVMRKAGLESSSPKLLKSLRSLKEINDEEKTLLRTLYRFPEVVVEAAKNLSPNLICSFLFDLAQKFNLFYSKHSILNLAIRHSGKSRSNSGTHPESIGDPGQARMTSEFRLSLTSATSIVIKRGLHLLGIDTVERM